MLRRAFGLARFAQVTVGASATSLFVADVSGGTLRGLVGDWDWTRTSFAARLTDWPTVARSFRDGEPRTITRHEARGNETIWFEPRGIASTVCVPVRRAAASSVGVLFFDFESEAAERSARDRGGFLSDIGERVGRALVREPSWRSDGQTYASIDG